MRGRVIAVALFALATLGAATVATQAGAVPSAVVSTPAATPTVEGTVPPGLALSAADKAKATEHMARYVAGATTAQVAKNKGDVVLAALFGTEDVAGSEAATLKAHDLVVARADGDVSLQMVPVAPGTKVGPFRAAVTVTDVTDGRLVTVLLIGKDDPAGKGDIAKVGRPEALPVQAADIAKARATS